MALSIEAPDTAVSRRCTDLDGLLRDQVCAMIATVQRRPVARGDVYWRAIGGMIFNNLNAMFIGFVKTDPATVAVPNAVTARRNAPLAGLLTA